MNSFKLFLAFWLLFVNYGVSFVNGAAECNQTHCNYRHADVFPFCAAAGDPHYFSLDLRRNDYQGTCKLTLMRSNVTTKSIREFTVYSKSEYRPGFKSEFNHRLVSFIKYVEVHVYNHIFRLGRNARLEVDGVLMVAPYRFPPTTDCPGLCSQVVVHKKRKTSLELATDFGLAVAYDGNHQLWISPPNDPIMHTQLEGICGNFDRNKSNDFTMPNGKLTNSENMFGDSWIATDSEDLDCLRAGKDMFLSSAAKNSAIKLCFPLNDTRGPFAACLQNPEGNKLAQQKHKDCIFDVAVSAGSTAVACQTLTAFADACKSRLHVPGLHWRNDSFCPPKCKAGMHFVQYLNETIPTCENPHAVHHHTHGGPTEDCVCDPGLLFDAASMACIKLSECGCKDPHGALHEIGSSWVEEGCRRQLTCLPNDTITEQPFSCEKPKVCEAKNGLFVCACPKGTELRNKQCIDLDECRHDVCGKHAECQNHKEGFSCHCLPGFEKNGRYCFPHNVTITRRTTVTIEETTIKTSETIIKETIRIRRCRKACRRKKSSERPFCMAFGDPHYISLDGKLNHYQGTCRLVAFQNHNYTHIPPVTVFTKSEHRTGWNGEFAGRHVSFIVYAEVEVYGTRFRLGRNGILEVNGITTPAPFYFPTSKGCQDKSPCQVYVEKFALGGLELTTDFGLSVSYDGEDTFMLSPPNIPNFRHHTGGICGYWDGDPENDYMMPNGVVTSDTKDFGDSWTMHDTEDLGCRKRDAGQTYRMRCPGESLRVAEQKCRPLKNSIGHFAKCLKYPRLRNMAGEFYHSCLYDVCAADGSDDIACRILTTFARVCQAWLGWTSFAWRTSGKHHLCPPVCGAGMDYSTSSSLILATCEDPFPDPRRDDGRRVEACVCEQGLVYDKVTKSCMKLEECGCRDDEGVVHKAGDIWIAPDCSVSYSCDVSHKITTTSLKCKQPLTCTQIGGIAQYGCTCPPGKEIRSGKCLDLDECGKHENICGENAVCENTPAGYHCNCNKGLVYNGLNCFQPRGKYNSSLSIQRTWKFHNSDDVKITETQLHVKR